MKAYNQTASVRTIDMPESKFLAYMDSMIKIATKRNNLNIYNSDPNVVNEITLPEMVELVKNLLKEAGIKGRIDYSNPKLPILGNRQDKSGLYVRFNYFEDGQRNEGKFIADENGITLEKREI